MANLLWNPADKGAGVTLSEGDVRAAFSSNHAVRAATGHDAGKHYFEIHVVNNGNTALVEGIATSAMNLSATPSDDGTTNRVNRPWAETNPIAGDVMGFAVDIDAGTMDVYRNNALQRQETFTPGANVWFPCAGQGGVNSDCRIYGSDGTTTYAPPAGFAYWQGVSADVSGTVEIDGAAASRIVTVSRADTGAYLGRATSDAGTGAYSITVAYDGSVTVTCTDDYGEPWRASEAVSANAKRIPTTQNGHWYEAQAAGTTGTTEPAWPTTGGTVVDGGVTWQDMGTMREPLIIHPYLPVPI